MFSENLEYSGQSCHVPVLASAVMQLLSVNARGLYVDGTAGGGGHSSLIVDELSSDGTLFAFDVDPTACFRASVNLEKRHGHKKNFQVRFGSFADDQDFLNVYAGQVDGILLDLGLSSDHIDQAERGFSYEEDTPLE